MLNNLVNIGYGNMVMASKVVAVLSPASAPMRGLKDEAKEQKRILDATQGRKTRAIIITDSDHVILSAVQVETLMQRFSGRSEPGEKGGGCCSSSPRRRAPARRACARPSLIRWKT